MDTHELKRNVESTGSYFFTREAMSFFGDTMRNFGVRPGRLRRFSGDIVDVWELYRRQPVKHGLKDSHFFHMETFEKVCGEEVGTAKGATNL